MAENQTSPDRPICVGCHGDRLVDFFHTAKAPVNCGSICRDHQLALAADMGEIRLVFCLDCELVHNQAFDFRKVDFRPGYEVALTHSKTFREFQQGVVERLISNFSLNEKSILEIGCGDGSFLKSICQAGNNHGVGIDPTVVKPGTEQLDSSSVRFIRDYFGEQYAEEIGDFVCCLSVFEDIPSPLEFLIMLKNMIDDRQPGLYFEVFNGFRSIEASEIWSIHYEQCNYFSLASLKSVFQRAGYRIADSGVCYQEGQYAFVEAQLDSTIRDTDAADDEPSLNSDSKLERPPALITEFSRQYRQRSEYWRNRLLLMKQQGQRVVLWGSGGKGISFLNAVQAKEEIQFVVDINPNRQGAFIPGTAQEIVPPERLIECKPDLIILTNPIYENEIRQQVRTMQLDCEFISV